MGFFDDDGFFGANIDDIFNKLSGEGFVEYAEVGPEGKKIYRRRGRSSYEKFFLEKIISEGKTFLIFDLSGKKNVSVEVSSRKQENNHGRFFSSETKFLDVHEGKSFLFSFPLENVKEKRMEKKFNNGILEVCFYR